MTNPNFSAGFRRSVVATAVLIAIASLLAAIYPEDAARFTRDLVTYDTNARAIGESRRSAAEFDDGFVRAAFRVEGKRRCVGDLLAGRVTLRSATERFIELDSDCPAIGESINRDYRGRTHEEKAARYLIDFAKRYLEDNPAPSDALARLGAQFREWFDSEVDPS